MSSGNEEMRNVNIQRCFIEVQSLECNEECANEFNENSKIFADTTRYISEYLRTNLLLRLQIKCRYIVNVVSKNFQSPELEIIDELHTEQMSLKIMHFKIFLNVIY